MSDEDALQKENDRLRDELGRAYRALHGFYNAFTSGEKPGDVMVGYHSLTIAAASRFVKEGSYAGTGYFVGKNVNVLHDALKDDK